MKSIFILAAVSCCAFAQNWQPNVTNARLEIRAFSGDLAAQLKSDTPVWFGYAAAAVSGQHSGDCRCKLEGGWEQSADRGPVRLEDPGAVAVLFRVSSSGVEKIQVHAVSCQIDAGGMRLIWLTGVSPEASLAFLEKNARTAAEPDGAMVAIALHNHPEADSILERFTRSSEPRRLREKATFWLGASRGERGQEILSRILAADPDPDMRDKAVFALSLNMKPKALALIERAAREDSSSQVRSQALFWLAQRAGDRASSAIQNAIENDPDTEVKKRAVFALSQIPGDEGVTKLIEVARTQRNPEVRKQAFFWLGQSRNPRALEFIEQTLEAR